MTVWVSGGDPVTDTPVAAPARRILPGVLIAQRAADAVRVVQDRPGDELGCGGGDLLGQAGKLPLRAGPDVELPATARPAQANSQLPSGGLGNARRRRRLRQAGASRPPSALRTRLRPRRPWHSWRRTPARLNLPRGSSRITPIRTQPRDRLIAAARDRFGRLDGALISVGGSPPGTVATTTDEAWRSAFESVFLGAVRLARILAADLGGAGNGSAAAGSVTGAGA
jgi:hypothetical protein